MTFVEILHSQFTLSQQLELMFRIVVAAICGGVIGIERSRRFKDAGVRTHALVACAAATLMIVSKYGFADLGMDSDLFSGSRGADPARIAAQIVSGISFLGVGVIYRDRSNATRGLTTAAGIWAMAGVGMAIGAGMYWLGLFFTMFVLLLQLLTHHFVFGKDKFLPSTLEINMKDDKDVVRAVYQQLEKEEVVILQSDLKRLENDMLTAHMVLRFPTRKDLKAVTNALLAFPEVTDVRLNEEER